MKQRLFLLKVGICLTAIALVAYRHVDEQNRITALRITLPKAVKEVRLLEEEVMHLRYQVEEFESPANLLSFAQRDRFAHLRYPSLHEFLVLREDIQGRDQEKASSEKAGSAVLAVGKINFPPHSSGSESLLKK
jgi:hypothetical protein